MKRKRYVVVSLFLLICVSVLITNLVRVDLWVKVYSFTPYTQKEAIYATIGYKWDRISETVSEGMNQIIFVKDGKVVCYVYGYPDNNQFGLYFEGAYRNDIATILYAANHPIFDVTKSEDVVYLKYKK